jgi:hypothetical protein
VIRKATQTDSQNRHQSVDEFWADLLAVREIVGETEPETLVRTKASAIPQPHVAIGYSPLAPVKPHFDTARDLRSRFPLIPGSSAAVDTVITHVTPTVLPDAFDDVELEFQKNRVERQPSAENPAINNFATRKRHRRIRRLAVFAAFIVIFGGALYGTGTYIRSTSLWSTIWSGRAVRTATANTDINLRAGPDADTDAIGLVTKNSRVRIVNSQNNWYQVDVIEQGRDRAGGGNATRGWLNGRYIDIDN